MNSSLPAEKRQPPRLIIVPSHRDALLLRRCLPDDGTSEVYGCMETPGGILAAGIFVPFDLDEAARDGHGGTSEIIRERIRENFWHYFVCRLVPGGFDRMTGFIPEKPAGYGSAA